eukprot:7932642-Ditylum_brightwellii.AAC.1
MTYLKDPSVMFAKVIVTCNVESEEDSLDGDGEGEGDDSGPEKDSAKEVASRETLEEAMG